MRVTARGGALAVPADRDPFLLADAKGERGADGDREHRRKVADHRDQPEVGVGHVHVAVAALRRTVLAAHVLGEDPPRLDSAGDVDAHVAVQGGTDVLGAERGGHSHRGSLVPAPRVEGAGDLALLVEDVAALLDPARDQHVPVDREQILTVETRFADLAQGADRLCFAGNSHATRPRMSEMPYGERPDPRFQQLY